MYFEGEVKLLVNFLSLVTPRDEKKAHVRNLTSIILPPRGHSTEKQMPLDS